ncbi:MAG TPA: nucleotide exchange factor GrpE [Chthoniobacterales bacterium]|nr:nucleotide exchange factor GrpE [Chthoniobacterales bacterium]
MRRIPVTESSPEQNRPTPRVENPDATSASSATGGSVGATAEIEEDGTEGLQADLDRFRDLALRSQADFENYKKRAAREKEEAIKYANSSLLERLIPVVDNFDLGLEAARGEGETSPVFSGMSMVLKQFMDFLTDQGLQPIDATGQKFDPNLHEAIANEPSQEFPEGVVIRQTRRGYRLKDRLLRPSSVVVSSGAAK